MRYFQSGGDSMRSPSELVIEWTNQHGCGTNDAKNPNKLNCDIIAQFTCGDDLKDGTDSGNLQFTKPKNGWEPAIRWNGIGNFIGSSVFPPGRNGRFIIVSIIMRLMFSKKIYKYASSSNATLPSFIESYRCPPCFSHEVPQGHQKKKQKTNKN